MGEILAAVARFFGFASPERPLEERLREAISDIGSQRRLDACAQAAYQIVQRKDALTPNKPHPYEATILGDCLKVDSLLTEYHSGLLSKAFGDAHYLVTLLGNGIQGELQSASAPSVAAKISGQIAISKPEADRIHKNLIDARKELQVFKGANGITRSAEYPSSISNSLYWIGAVAILEAITNAWFLREQSQAVVALIIAVAIAALNVGGSVWLGIRYREKNFADHARAQRGRRYIIFAILFILFLNCGVAGYRLLIQSQYAGLATQFVFESTVLLVIGVALGITAFNKGYALDDPFPNYGSLARKLKALEDQWTDISQQHATFCENEKSRALEAHRSLIQKLSGSGQSLASHLPEMARRVKAWSDERGHLNYAYSQLQAMFRTTLVANHADGASYPTEPLSLKENSQLVSYEKQVTEFLESRSRLREELEKLILVVEQSQKALEQWILGQEAQLLWRWPN